MTEEKKKTILNIILGMMIIYVLIFGSLLFFKSAMNKLTYYTAKKQYEDVYENPRFEYEKSKWYSNIEKYKEFVTEERDIMCLDAVKENIENNTSFASLVENDFEKLSACNLSKTTKLLVKFLTNDYDLSYFLSLADSYRLTSYLQFYEGIVGSYDNYAYYGLKINDNYESYLDSTQKMLLYNVIFIEVGDRYETIE